MNSYYTPTKSQTSNSSTSSPSIIGKAMKSSLLMALMLMLSMGKTWAVDYHKSTTATSAFNAGTTWGTTACAVGGLAWPTTSADNAFINCAAKTTTPSVTMACGNLTISAGTLTISSGTLTVNGDLLLNGGTLNINGTGVLTVLGNLTFTSGTFSHTAGTVNLSGAAQNVGGAMTPSFFNLNVAGSGNKTLTGNVTVANILTFTNNKLNIGSNTLSVNGTVVTMTAAKCFVGSATSNLTFGGTAAVGTVFFDQTSAATRTIATYTSSTGTSTHTVTLGNKLEIGTACNLTAGTIILNGQELVLNGTFTGTSTATGCITATNTATLTIGGTGALGTLFFTNSTPALSVFNINRTTSGTLSIGGTSGTTAVTVTTLNMTAGQTTLVGDLVMAAAGTITGTPSTSNMIVTSATSGYFVHNYATGASSKLYPVGEVVGVTTGEYNGFTVTVASNTVARTVGWKVVDAALTSPPTNYLSRYFVSKASSTSTTFTWSTSLPFNGSTGDINGAETSMFAGYNTASTYALTSIGTVNTSTHTLDITAGTSTQLNATAMYFTGAEIACASPSGPQSFNVTTISNTSTPVTMTGNVGLQFNTNVTGVIIFANTSNVNAVPVTSTDYNVGDVLPSGSICIFKGGAPALGGASGSNYTSTWSYDASVTGGTDLSPNTFYYFNTYSYASDATCNTKYSSTSGFASMAPNINLSAPGTATACNNTANSFNLAYSSTSGSPDQYSLIWNSAAAAAGFVNEPSSNVSNTLCGANFISLPGSPIVVSIPAGIAPGTYSGYINPKNSTNGYDNCTYSGAGLSNCPSFTVTITAGTAAPTGTTPQAACPGYTVSNLVATGTAIQWYAAATGGSPLAGSTALVSGNHYYASQTVGGCESSARLDVTVVAPLSGTVTVGSGGTYNTLSEAGAGGLFQAINTLGLGGNLTVNMLSSTTETGAVALNAWTNFCGGPWTVNIRPDATVSSTITASSTVTPITLNGVTGLTMDGVPAGSSGSNVIADSKWIIKSTSTTLPTIIFTKSSANVGCTANTLKYLQIQGQNITKGQVVGDLAGVVNFSGTPTATNGNTSNIITYCAIGDNGAGTPANCIYSFGSSTASMGNDNNQVTNCNIYNFWQPATITNGLNGINLQNYNAGWTISDNSFYQTASRTATANNTTSAILVNNSVSGTGFTISNNYIGGGAAGATGSAWTITGNFVNAFTGINVTQLTSGTSTASGNVITNISWLCANTSAVLPGIFTGIFANSNGTLNITGNTIGATTGNGSITITDVTTTGANSYGIGHNSTSGFVNIQNNNIGSITLLANATTISHNFTAIQYAQGGSANARTISGNLIGSTSTANSIYANCGSSSVSTAQSVIGISNGGAGANAASITNNTIANLTNNLGGATTLAGLTYGIYVTSGVNTITGNTVRNLSSTSIYTNTNGIGTAGIYCGATASSGQTIAQNTIHSLSNTTATANAVNVTGIFYSGPASGTNSISRNFIHSLSTTSSAASFLSGIDVSGSSVCTVDNNMVRQGINANGTDLTGGHAIRGIYKNSSGACNIYFNSVYIGGASVTGTATTSALYRATSGTGDVFKDNILVNARSNGSGTGKHLGILSGVVTNLTSDYNLIFVSGTGGIVGQNALVDYATLTAWSSGTSVDANSVSGDPMFISPAGDASAVNLHIQPSPTPTPIEGAGTNISAITVDFDGQTRASFSPEDIGADADNFTAIDLTPPSVTYTAIPSACNSASSYSFSSVTITDAGSGSSVNTTSGTMPRVYFKKSADANTVAGWQYVEATGTTSPFTFNIPFSSVGGVVPGDVIQYFVVAQDQGPFVPSPNVAINSGVFAATPASVALTSAAFPISGTIKSFTIMPCQGTVTVGVGGNYIDFTSANGLFQAINATTVTGNLTVNVVSNITTEDGTNALNQFTSPYTLTIQSSAAANRDISGSYNGSAIANNGLFRMNGADNVTFNGGTTTNRYLTFRNTNTGAFASTFNFINDATSNTLNNCIIEGGSATTTIGTIYFGTGTVGNTGNTIDKCDIRDLTTTTATPANAIYSAGSSTTVTNIASITNCNIFNYYAAAAASNGIILASNSTGWTISSNKFYQTSTRTATAGAIHRAINIITASGGGYTINNNTIGFGLSDATGTTTYTGAFANRFIGIELTGSAVSNIQGNTIAGITLSTTSGATTAPGIFSGISVLAGAANIGNTAANNIGTSAGNGGISITATTSLAYIAGITSNAASTINVDIENNNIGYITTGGTAAIGYTFYGIHTAGAGNYIVSGNNIGNSSTDAIRIGTSGTTTTGVCTAAGIFANNSGSLTASSNVLNNITEYAPNATSYIYGINAPLATSLTLSLNSITNLKTTSTNSAAYAMIGLYSIAPATNQLIERNTIATLTANGSANLASVYFGNTASSGNFRRNKVGDLISTATLPGLQAVVIAASSASGWTMSNNMISVTNAGNAVSGSVYGFYDNAATGAVCNYYYNSVYVGGVTNCPTCGTNASFCYVRVNSPTVTLKNNIFVNDRVGSGGTPGYHYAIGNASTTPATGWSVSASDNNVLNSTTGSIGGWNTTLNMNFATWKSTSGGDTKSLSGIPVTFTSTATANLKLNMGTTPTSIESGAVDVGISLDQEGDARPGPTGSVNGGGSLPDIGADEFDGVKLDVFAPVITYTPVSAGCAYDYVVSAIITDATGVPTSGSTRPTIYYKKSTDTWGVSSYSGQGTLASGTATNGTWNFTIVASNMSLAGGETVQYFIAAQDAVTPTPNIAANPSAGFSATDVNTIITYPTTPNSYTVNPTLAAGTYTVGSGGNYATLTAAVAAYNASCLGGPVVFSLINTGASAYTTGTGETFPIKINYNVSASSVNTLTIKPAATKTPTISGTSGTTAGNNGLIIFNGCTYVTLDGSNGASSNAVCPASAATRDLTIVNTNPTFTSTNAMAVIWLQNNGTTSSATYNTVQNCVVNFTGAGAGSGIGIGGNTGTYYSLMYGNGNNYNSIINNSVANTSGAAQGYGIIVQGGSATTKDVGNVINQNIVGYSSAAAQTSYLSNGGIVAGWQDNLTVSGNTVNGVYSSSYNACGIGLGIVYTGGLSAGLVGLDNATYSGNEVTNATITNNKIGLVGCPGSGFTRSAAGIIIATVSTGTGTTTIANNSISGVYGGGGTTAITAGLFLGGGNGTTKVYNNTVNMASVFYTSPATNTPLVSLAVGGSNPVLDIRNNIFSTNVTGTSINYWLGCMAFAYTTLTNLTMNYNDVIVTGSNSGLAQTGGLGTSGTNYSTFANWQATGKDANSKNVAPTFTSSTDLHLTSVSGNLTSFGGTGTPIATVTTDFDCQTRDAVIPDLGFDEFAAKNDAGITAVSTSCSGLQTVTATIKNFSSSLTLNTVDVTWSVDAVGQGTVSFSGLSLAPGASVVQTLGTYTFSAGSHTVVAATSVPNAVADANPANDSYTQTGYAGLPSTVYVGTGAGTPAFSDFNTLFGVINGSGLTADLTVLVQSSVTEPSTPTFLKETTACSGGPYHIYIQPATATTYTISGSTGSSTYPGMIGFDGASLVSIDGQFSSDGNKWLTFRNTNNIYPAVTFINGSNNISVAYSTIESNNNTTYVSGSLTNKPGTVFFGNASASVGNNNISINHNDIRDRSDATGVPANGIFSLNSVASIYNNTNTITDNNFYNFFQCGVYIAPTGNGASWNISNNKFYNPSNLASYEASVPQQIAIYVSAGSTCHSNTISGNTIGGSTSSNSGTWLNSLSAIDFEAIRLDIGGTSGQTTTVNSNVIKNISLTGTGLSGFIGIRVKNGLVDITGNTIGDLSATFASPSIQCNGNGTNGTGDNNNTFIYGIWNYSTSASTISGNTVAGIRGGSSGTSGGWSYVTGIRRGAKEFGSNALVQYAGQSTINNNTVANLFSNSLLSANFISGVNIDLVWPGALTGIAVASNYASDNSVRDNNVNNLTAYGNWNRWVKVMGIAANGDPSSPVDNGSIYNNQISKLSNYNGGLAWTPQIAGIELGYLNSTNTFTVYNNMIGLYPNNSDAGSNSSYNDMDLYGILDDADASHSNTNKYYNNTVYLAGANLSGGVAKDYAYFRCGGGDGSVNGGTTYLKNNILINNRTGGGTHYAIGNQGSSPSVGFSAANIDYNFFSTLNTATVGNKQVGAIGSATSTDYSFTGWQSQFSTDANSLYAQATTGTSNYSTNPATATVNPTAGNLFVDPTDITTSGSFLHASITDLVSYQFISDNGVDLSAAGVTADIDGGSRSATPDKGADEFVATPPANTIALTTVSFGPFCNSSSTNNISLNYTTTGTVTSPFIELSNNSGSFASGTTNLGGTVTPGSPNNIAVNLPSALAAGTYRVRIVSTDAIPVISNDNGSLITVTALPTASISYAGTPFCTSLATGQSVTLSGSGGSFPAVSGLTINSGTGAITPSTSTPGGPYTVNYVIPASGGCAQVTANTTVTITALPTATISYSGTPFCSTSGSQSVTLSGSGGSFPAVSGLTLNSSTGAITPSTSTPGGPYTVNYVIPTSGGCAQVTASTSVTINPAPAAVTFTSATSTNNNLTPCLVANNYTINAQAGYTYSWSVPSGWSAVSGGTTTQITVTPSLAAGNVTASVSIAGCTASSASLSVTPVTVPSAPVANPVLGVGTSPQTTGIGTTNFTANWATVSGATGYNLDVSTSSTFSTSAAAITEGFEGVTFPPTGWANVSWVRSTTAGDFVNGAAGATATSNTGTLTTPVVANPTNMTFYLGRSSNATAKTLTIEVSTTSQSSGFSTVVATYDHNNVPSASYNQYTVDLSAFTSNSTVYIRFNKSSSTTSPWRLDDVVINSSTPSYVSGYQDLSVSGTSQSVTGLSTGTTYYYRLRASNACGTSGNSNVVSATTRSLTATALSSFGTRCFGSSTDLSFNLSGTGLDGTDVTIGPLSGFQFSANGGAFGSTATYSGYATSFTNIPITVRFLPTGSGLVSFNGNIPASGGGATSINIAATASGTDVPAQPTITAGSLTPCPSSVGTYSVANVAGVTYAWTLPSGWSGTSTTNSISATASATPGSSGTISVVPSIGSCAGTAQTWSETVTTLPSQPSVISTPGSPCAGSTGNVYSVTSVGGVTYTWAVSGTGWSIPSASTTNSVTITAGSANGGITVTPYVNGCAGPTRTLTGISVVSSYVPTVSISNSSTSVCINSSNTFTATRTDGNGGSAAYSWKVNGTQVSTSNPYTATAGTFANGDAIICDMTVTGSCAVPSTATSNTYFAQKLAYSPTQLWIENFGTSDVIGVQNYTSSANPTFTFTTGGTPIPDVKTSTVSPGGGANVFMGATGFADRYFTISGINTTGAFPNKLSFYFYNPTTTVASPDFRLQYSTDGTNFYEVNYGTISTAGWSLVSVYNVLPQSATVSLRFISNLQGSVNIRIDDIKLESYTTGDAAVSASPTGPFCGSGSTTITATPTAASGLTYAWNNGSLFSPSNPTINNPNTTTISSSGSVVTTNFTTTITDIFGCTSSATKTVVVNPVPNTYTVTGTGSYCSGDAGLNVGINSSQTAVNYQLYFNGTPQGSPVAGTGNPSQSLFGAQTAAGTYTVVATHSTGSCTATMTGSAVITVNPLPTAYTLSASASSYCLGVSGVTLDLSNSQTNTSYQLLVDGVNTGSPVTGTGSSISFGNQIAAGTYTVTATNTSLTPNCSSTMTGSPAVTINPVASVQLGGSTAIFTQAFTSGLPSGWSINTPSGSTYDWVVTSATPSTGYTGASGGNRFTVATSAAGANSTTTSQLISQNYSISGYSNISVVWAARKTASYPGSGTFYYSTNNGSSWTQAAFIDVAGNSTWSLVNNGIAVSLPLSAGATTLKLRWDAQAVTTLSNYGLDDVSIYGLANTTTCTNLSSVAINYAASANTTGYTLTAGTTALASFVTQSGTLSSGGGTLNLVIPSGSAAGSYDFDLSLTNGASCNKTHSIPVVIAPTPSVTAVIDECAYTSADKDIVLVTGSGGTTPITYTSSNVADLPLTSISNYLIPFEAPTDGLSRTFTATDASGCIASSGAITTYNNHPTDIPYASATGTKTVDCYSKNLNRWLTFRDNTNKAILSIKDNNQDLGLVTVSVYREGAEPAILNSSNHSTNTGVGNCYLYPELAMKRHFAITTEKTFSQSVDVRLYFSDAELQSLITTSTVPPSNPNDGCAKGDDVHNINQLYVTKYSGPNVDGSYTNNSAANQGGIYRMFGANVTSPNTAFDAVSSGGFTSLFSGAPTHHYLQMHVTEFSEFWLHGSDEIYPLPVDMIYLEANAINNAYIQLTWATALEVNNDGFIIERSVDGQNWSQIAFVDGHDNSTIQNDYSYDDLNVTTGIRYYYRLKQVDNDGQFKYTDIVSAMLSGDITFSVKDFVPNPAGDKTTLLITATSAQELTVEIFDIIGQKVSSNIHTLNRGLNRLDFDVSYLASGTYSAVVYSGNATFTKKLVITK